MHFVIAPKTAAGSTTIYAKKRGYAKSSYTICGWKDYPCAGNIAIEVKPP